MFFSTKSYSVKLSICPAAQVCQNHCYLLSLQEQKNKKKINTVTFHEVEFSVLFLQHPACLCPNHSDYIRCKY